MNPGQPGEDSGMAALVKASTFRHWLFVNDSWYARRDGDVYVADSLDARVWARYRRHVDGLVVMGRELPPEQSEVATTRSSADAVEFRLGPNISGLGNRARHIGEASTLVRAAVNEVDAVIARLPSEYGLLAVREARRQGKPWLVELVGDPWDGLWHHGSWQGRLYAPVMVWRVRRAVARADYLSYVTRHFLQRRYPNHHARQIACSNVAIDAPDEAVLAARLRKIERRDSPATLGLIGTLKTRQKGIQTVLAALARARERLPPVEFRVLGVGDPAPWRAEAESHGVADLVHFDEPRAPGAEVMAWLDQIDIYLQPSFHEGLPRATIEAMSRGCPALGSTCAGIPELLDRDCLIRPGDEAGLAQLLEQAVGNPEWQRRQARANWREAHQYTASVLEARRQSLLEEFARHQ